MLFVKSSNILSLIVLVFYFVLGRYVNCLVYRPVYRAVFGMHFVDTFDSVAVTLRDG